MLHLLMQKLSYEHAIRFENKAITESFMAEFVRRRTFPPK